MKTQRRQFSKQCLPCHNKRTFKPAPSELHRIIIKISSEHLQDTTLILSE
jgi:hypothetical protein